MVTTKRLASLLSRCALALALLVPVVSIATAQPVAAQSTLSTISVDPGQDPFATEPTPVWAIIEANGRYYIGGRFSQVEGQTQSFLAAVNTATGQLETRFDPVIVGGTTEIKAIALSPNGQDLYIGGNFRSVDGVFRNRIAKVDAFTGIVDPTFNPDADALIESIAVDSTGVYVGGRFNNIGGANVSNLARLDPVTGAHDQAFNATVSGTVFDLELFNNNLYVGGNFRTANGQGDSNLVRLQTSNGATHGDWNPTYQLTDRVLSLSLSANGQTVFAGTAGTLRDDGNGNSAWSLTTRGQRNWQRPLGGDVQALEAFGDSLFVGTHGEVVFIEPKFELDGVTRRAAFPNDGYVENPSTNPNAIQRQKLFSLDQGTGAINAFDPDLNSINGVWELESGPSGLLVGGDFTRVLNPTGQTGLETTIDTNHVAIFANPFLNGALTPVPTPDPVPGPGEPFACVVTISGSNAVITYTGSPGSSTQLLRDGSWNRTVTGLTTTLVTGGAGSDFAVRARGEQFANPFEDIACTSDGTVAPDPAPNPPPLPVGGTLSCAVSFTGGNADVTFTGDTGRLLVLRVNGSWVANVAGTSATISATSNDTIVARVRGPEFTQPFEDITCTGGAAPGPQPQPQPQPPVNPGVFACSVTTVGNNATITYTGDQGNTAQLLSNGIWNQTITGQASTTITGGAGNGYSVRLRGPLYTQPFQDFTCTPG